MEASQESPESCDPLIVLRRPFGPSGSRIVDSVSSDHRSELEDLEDVSVLTDALLGEEQRSSVRQGISEEHERHRRRQHDDQHDSRGDINEAFRRRVPGSMDLGNVEHQGDALHFRRRKLPDPLLIEPEQAPDPHSGPVDDSGLTQDGCVSLSTGVQNQQGDLAIADEVDQRAGAVRLPHRFGGHDIDERCRALQSVVHVNHHRTDIRERSDRRAHAPPQSSARTGPHTRTT